MNRNSFAQEVGNSDKNVVVFVRLKNSEREAILCPLCLTEIPKDALLKLGVEHIIPKVTVKDDPPHLTGSTPKNMITQNQRSGITVLCRRCNGLKRGMRRAARSRS